MPPCDRHIQKARENIRFAVFVLKGKAGFVDWVITAYFYAAVHLVEAYFNLTTKRGYGTHTARRIAISRDAQISGLFNTYRKLETYSRTARYGVKPFDVNYLNNRVVPKFELLRSAIGTIDKTLAL